MQKSYQHLVEELETITDFLRFGLTEAGQAQLYFGHGTDNAWDDIYALMLGSLSLPLDVDANLLDARLTKNERQLLASQLEKRLIEQVPVPYLTHEAYFCDLPFFVDERVLIPRSPMAECIKHQFEPFIHAERVTRILDMCTGSACIAIACCYAFPDACVDAVDVSRDALDVAQINRVKHGVEDRLNLLQSDCFDALPRASYDVIVCNPPYVNEAEKEGLPKEYHHEPELALYADKKGLAIVDKMLLRAANFLSDDGILMMEVGNSEETLIDAYPDVPFAWLDFEHGGRGVFVLTKSELESYFKS